MISIATLASALTAAHAAAQASPSTLSIAFTPSGPPAAVPFGPEALVALTAVLVLTALFVLRRQRMIRAGLMTVAGLLTVVAIGMPNPARAIIAQGTQGTQTLSGGSPSVQNLPLHGTNPVTITVTNSTGSSITIGTISVTNGTDDFYTYSGGGTCAGATVLNGANCTVILSNAT